MFIVEDKERLIRQHLERRKEEDFRSKRRLRVAVEHAIAGFAQCGGKQARRFGQAHTDFDASLSALAYNLRRLGSVLKSRKDLQARADEARRLFAVVAVQLLLLALSARQSRPSRSIRCGAPTGS